MALARAQALVKPMVMACSILSVASHRCSSISLRRVGARSGEDVVPVAPMGPQTENVSLSRLDGASRSFFFVPGH
jgi:hypothetical protein